MDLSQLLAVAGIAVILVGVLIGTLGVIAPSDPSMRPDWHYARQDSLKRMRMARRMGYVSPPYPEQVVREAFDAADESYEREVKELVKDLAEIQVQDTWHRQKLALWALLFVAAGSILQGVAVLTGP
jgi:hypothetical protein